MGSVKVDKHCNYCYKNVLSYIHRHRYANNEGFYQNINGKEYIKK